MIKLIVILFVMIAPLAFPGDTVLGVADANWQFYGKAEPFMHYYDDNNISYPSKKMVRLWTKEECNDRNKCVEIHRKWIRESKGQLSSAYEKWTYRLSYIEMDCKNEKMRFLSVKNVDENGKTIDSDSEENPTNWLAVKNPWNQPDPLEHLYKLVCK